MGKCTDLTNQTFGQWTVLGDSGRRLKSKCGNSRIKWLCKCSCGETALITTRGLTSGRSKRCSRCAQRKINPIRQADDFCYAVACSNGQEFYIDDAALPFIEQYYWNIDSSNHVTSNTCGHRVHLARLLLALSKDDERQVDHISGNPLDNRRYNLRLCSPLENARNRPTRSDNQTGYKGISYRKPENKYVARISPRPGERIFLGRFGTPEEGALFAIGSDAHELSEMDSIKDAVQIIEMIGIGEDRLWQPKIKGIGGNNG